MECSNCKKNVSEDSLFCEHCGQKIEKNKDDKKPDETFEDSNKIKSKIIEHLEYIGYEVTAMDAVDKYLGKHQSKPTLIITIGNGISFGSVYQIDVNKVKKNKAKALEFLNKMNNTSFLSNFSLTPEEENLYCASWYPSIYSKKTFADFLDFFENDIRRAFQIEGVMEIFS
jgi:hypothetical protein